MEEPEASLKYSNQAIEYRSQKIVQDRLIEYKSSLIQ